MRAAQALAGLVALAPLTGCLQLDYVLQAAEGQLELACTARSIDSVLEREDLDPETRALLSEVGSIKAFGERQGLVATANYADYVALDRPSVVYVVTAAPDLSLEPETFWFPIVGSVPYLGYFDRWLAEHRAGALAAEGFDVDVRGARAYSTLGWFDDPILSSMLFEGPGGVGDLANTILHESVHATLYVAGQSEFNEGLATFIGDELAPRWLAERFGDGSLELAAYEQDEARAKELRRGLAAVYQEVLALYRSKRSRVEKLTEKRRIMREAESRLELSRPLNNARLSAYDAYNGPEQHFSDLFVSCGRSIPKMIAACRGLSSADFGADQQSDLAPVLRLAAKRCEEPATGSTDVRAPGSRRP